jgi:hypothetical protein
MLQVPKSDLLKKKKGSGSRVEQSKSPPNLMTWADPENLCSMGRHNFGPLSNTKNLHF